MSEKDPISTLASSRISNRIMQNKGNKKKLLVQNVLDASVNFQSNGNILVMPCPWENEKEVTVGGKVNYKAGVEVDCDGRTRVKRYNVGMNGPMHNVLFETSHGALKMTRPQFHPSDNGRRRVCEEYVYVTFKFPKKYGLALTKAFLAQECDEILSYLKTRKENTIWD